MTKPKTKKEAIEDQQIDAFMAAVDGLNDPRYFLLDALTFFIEDRAEGLRLLADYYDNWVESTPLTMDSSPPHPLIKLN